VTLPKLHPCTSNGAEPKPLPLPKGDWDWQESLFQVPRDQAWKSACGIFFERALPSLSSDRVDAARGKSCGTVGETGRHLRRQQEALSPIVGGESPCSQKVFLVVQVSGYSCRLAKQSPYTEVVQKRARNSRLGSVFARLPQAVLSFAQSGRRRAV